MKGNREVGGGREGHETGASRLSHTREVIHKLVNCSSLPHCSRADPTLTTVRSTTPSLDKTSVDKPLSKSSTALHLNTINLLSMYSKVMEKFLSKFFCNWQFILLNEEKKTNVVFLKLKLSFLDLRDETFKSRYYVQTILNLV